MKRKVQEYFFYFMLYSILGWIYECFLKSSFISGDFLTGRFIRSILRYIWSGGSCFDYFIGKGKTKSGTYWEMECDADFDFYCNHRNYYSDRIDWKLYYGIHKGRMAVDYTRFRFNYQGRIALNPSIRFGIGGMISYMCCSRFLSN